MRDLTRRITGFLISFIMIVHMGAMTSYAKPDWPADTGVMAEAGIVVDMDSGAVLFGQQIHVPFPPASIAKLLTALVVVENVSLDETVTFSNDAIYNVESGSGNKLALEEGDTLSVEECLHLLLLQSSNQCANALAEHVAGSREGFVEMMNQRIAQIGCGESHFANPSGLNDDNQYVSAYDMALIAVEAFKNETVLKISSTKQYRISQTTNNPEGANISMEHRILMAQDSSSEYYCQGAVAGKTGYTSIAGNTLVTYAERDGRKLVSVILKGSQPQYYLDGKTILNFGFSSFKNESVYNSETFMQEQSELEIQGKTYPMSQLRLEDGLVTIPAGAEFFDAERAFVTELPDGAPAGAVAMLQYTYNDRKVGSAYLYDIELEARLAAEEASREAAEASGENQEEEGEISIEPDETPDETDPGQQGSQGRGFRPGVKTILAAVGITGILAAGGGAGVMMARRKRQERIRREERRERRRKRLAEIGYKEEDFEELVRRRRENTADTKNSQK